MSERHTCPEPGAFVADLRAMFDRLDPETIRASTSGVLRDMIETIRQHQVGGVARARWGGPRGGGGRVCVVAGVAPGGWRTGSASLRMRSLVSCQQAQGPPPHSAAAPAHARPSHTPACPPR